MDKRTEDLYKEIDRFNRPDKYINTYMRVLEFIFRQSSGSMKGELKFLFKKILINLFIFSIIISLYYIFR